MTWIEFRNALIEYKVFSTGDIKKYFPRFDTKRLVEWQQKKYIRKLINKWYLFAEIPVDEMLLFRICNCIYQPSYISLESALGFYHFIPEAVYSQQAVTTRKTITYKTTAGTFNYRTLKPSFYFGNDFPFLMKEANNVYSHIKIYEANTVDDIIKMISKNKQTLFSATPSNT